MEKAESTWFYSIKNWETTGRIKKVRGTLHDGGCNVYIDVVSRNSICTLQRLGVEIFEVLDDAQEAVQRKTKRRLISLEKQVNRIKALRGKDLPVTGDT